LTQIKQPHNFEWSFQSKIMGRYQQYTTSLKIYYALGLEKHFVPLALRDQVPSSTAADWKAIDVNKIIGIELDKKLPKDLKELNLLYDPAGKLPKDMAVAMTQFIKLVQLTVGSKLLRKSFRNHKSKVVNFILDTKDVLSIQSFSKIMDISTKTIYDWIHQMKFKCDHSALFLCTKRHPNQATIIEVEVIKSWLSKVEYAHWSIHSIWAKAFAAGESNLARQSWYRYNKLIGFRSGIKKGKRPHHNSIKTSQIHEVWHADITVFKPLDGIRYYIYTVMDNYSRYILSWRIERVVSADIRLATIQEALLFAFGNSTPRTSVQLVTDGGPENANNTLKSFMKQNSRTIHQTIALRDIVQSNSMMEAFYKTTKYSFLYLQKIENYGKLHAVFKKWIQEYHEEKPHFALGIYTPKEVLDGADKFENYGERMKAAGQARREFNKTVNCTKGC